ncbi:hypothetical protein ACOMHN_005557 [Nucella lapillus]
MASLTPKEIEEYREAFKVMDKDGNGSISAEELGNILRAKGATITDQQVTDLIKTYDSNGDGDIDFDEFTKLMAESEIASAARFAVLFKSLDSDGDGTVSADELRGALKKSGVGVTEQQLQALLDTAESKQGNKELSFEEFLKAVSK